MHRIIWNALCLNAIIILTATAKTTAADDSIFNSTYREAPLPTDIQFPSMATAQTRQTSYESLPYENLPEADYYNTGYEMHAVDQVLAAPTYPTVRFTGFFQADAGWMHQSGTNAAEVGRGQDGAGFRRARLQGVGDAWDNVGYSIEFDFGFPGRPTFMDVWLEIRDMVGASSLRIGQYRQPIGMDGQTSVKELTFIERALPFALIPLRQIGGMLHGTGEDDNSTWAISMYRFPTDANGNNIGDSGGYGMATRLTSLAVEGGENDLLLHIGGAFSFSDPTSNMIRYRSAPEFTETGDPSLVPPGVMFATPAFVDTDVIMTNNVSLFGGELAARMGAFHMESEVLVSVVNRIGAGNAVFPGAYVQAGYALTGEVRPYKKNAGVLGQITPFDPVSRAGGGGAWEVAARWSYLDLNAGTIQGGMLNNLTFGLNWYLNPHTKFQLNYIHAMLDGPMFGNSNADMVSTRAQLDF